MNCELCGSNCEKRFCSKTCSSRYASNFADKNKPQGKCKTCKTPIHTRITYCQTCRKTRKIIRKKQESSKFCSICGIEKTTDNTYFVKKDKFYSYCKDCSKQNANERARQFKQECIDYKGGKCEKCGYNNNNAVLQFHHLDPSKKDFEISRQRCTKLEDKIKLELDKCAILCANCHIETHFPTG